ncbi:MAG: threonine/serine exporter family protein [Sporomusaceae bacterium]|nr:threonine/serine exporter family protein [Sporomusaceae bacterium]
MDLYSLLTVFIMSVSIGILYRIPRASLFYASFVGTGAYFTQQLSILVSIHWVAASFFGSVAAAFLSEVFARRWKKPATIYLIPGFIPLVPGREAYLAMTYLVKGQYEQGAAMAMRALLTASAIAFGIFVCVSFFRFMINRKIGSHTKNVRKN